MCHGYLSTSWIKSTQQNTGLENKITDLYSFVEVKLKYLVVLSVKLNPKKRSLFVYITLLSFLLLKHFQNLSFDLACFCLSKFFFRYYTNLK